MTPKRRQCRTVHIGGVPVGPAGPVCVQSMTKTHTSDIDATLRQIVELAGAGCEIVRVAVPDAHALRAARKLVDGSPVPLVADVHFDWRLAVASIEAGLAACRINPGNIRRESHLKHVVDAASAAEIPIRIGLNSGSVRTRRQLKNGRKDVVGLMVEAAKRYSRMFEGWGFDRIILSLKCSNVIDTIRANEQVARETEYPLHIGVTAAGPQPEGLVKNALGAGILLWYGIGDTLRVSLTGPPLPEVEAAFAILASLGLRQAKGVRITSCPTCGRCRVDVAAIVREVKRELSSVDAPVTVAVMGCVVNGPGEASDAEVGIACAKGYGVLFKRGEVIGTIREAEIVPRLVAEVRRLAERAPTT